MRAIRFGLLIVLCIAGVGCRQETNQPPAGNGAVSSAATKSGKPFVVAIPTYPGFAIPYLAKEKRLFEGVNVELKRMDDAAAINAGLIRGDIDACFTSVDSFVLAASQDVEAKAVLMSDESRGADGIVVKPDINGIADLKGKKVAANLGWPGHFFLLYNMQKEGVPFSDVSITNMDADKAGAAFVSGNLDAAVTWEPWLSKATSEANAKILVSTSTLPGVILDVMLVRSQTVTERPEAVQAFVNAYYEALALYKSDPDGSTKIMAEALGLPAADFQAMTEGFRFIPQKEAVQMLKPGDGGAINLFGEAASIWLKADVIDKPVPTANRVTNQFVQAYVDKK